MPDESPLVSVIIPCFNRSDELRRSIRSVLRQTEARFEVIVGDDGSTEDLGAVLGGFHDKRLRLARRPSNGGISAGRNIAQSLVSSPMVAYLDSDDEWHPNHLTNQLEAFARWSPGIAAVSTWFEMKYPSGRVDVRRPRQHADLTARIVRGVDLAAGSTMMIRTSALEAVGPWPEDIQRNEDYDWFLRMARQGLELRIVPTVSVTIHADDRSPLDRRAQARSHELILERHLPTLRDRPALGRHLRAKLHEERAWSAWRGGDVLGCAREVGAALALDPVYRGAKLGRSFARRTAAAVGSSGAKHQAPPS